MGQTNLFANKKTVYELRDSLLGVKEIDEPSSIDSFFVKLERSKRYYGLVKEIGENQPFDIRDYGGVEFLRQVYEDQLNPIVQFVVVTTDDFGVVNDEFTFTLLNETYKRMNDNGTPYVVVDAKILKIDQDFNINIANHINISSTEDVRGNTVVPVEKKECLLYSQVIEKKNISKVNIGIPEQVSDELNSFLSLDVGGNSNSSGRWYITPNEQIRDNINNYNPIVVVFNGLDNASSIFDFEERGELEFSMKFYFEVCLLVNDGVLFVEKWQTTPSIGTLLPIRVNIVLLDKEGNEKQNKSFIQGIDSQIQYVGDGSYTPSPPLDSFDTSLYYFDYTDLFDIEIGDSLFFYINTDTSGLSAGVHLFTYLRSTENISYPSEWDFNLKTIAPETKSNYIEIEDAINAIVERITKGSATVTIDKDINWDDGVKLMSGFDIRGVHDELFLVSFDDIMNSLRSIWGIGYAIRPNQEIYIAHLSKFFSSAGEIDLTNYPVDSVSEGVNNDYQKTLIEYGFTDYAKNTISSEEEQSNNGDLGFHTKYVRNTPLETPSDEELDFLSPFPADSFLIEFHRRKNELFKEGQSASEDDLKFFCQLIENPILWGDVVDVKNNNVKNVNFLSLPNSNQYILTINNGRFIDIYEISDVLTFRVFTDDTGLILDEEFTLTITQVNVIDNNYTTVLSGFFTEDPVPAYDITSKFWNIEKISGSNYVYPLRGESGNLANPNTYYNKSLTPNSIFENNSPIFNISKSAPTDIYRFISGLNNVSAVLNSKSQNGTYQNSELSSNIFSWKVHRKKLPLPYLMVQRLRDSLNGTGSEPYYQVKFLDDRGEEKLGWIFEMNYLVSLTETELLIFEKQE